MKKNNDKISKILALALFESEKKQTVRQQCLSALQRIVALIDQSPKFYSFVISSMFSKEEKEIFFSLANPPKSLLLFLRLTIEQNAISQLRNIACHYETFVYTSMGKIKAKVIVSHAHDVSQSFEERLGNKLEEILKKKVRFDFEVDPSLLGGFQLETNDLYLDASLKKTLADLQNSL